MGGGGGRVRGEGVQGRCERRSEVSVKIQKNFFFFFFLGGGGGGGGGGVMVDVNREVKFFVNLIQFFFLGGGGVGWRGRVRGGGSGWGGVRMDVNKEGGSSRWGGGGHGRCEQRSEVFCEFNSIFFSWGGGGLVGGVGLGGGGRVGGGSEWM